MDADLLKSPNAFFNVTEPNQLIQIASKEVLVARSMMVLLDWSSEGRVSDLSLQNGPTTAPHVHVEYLVET